MPAVSDEYEPSSPIGHALVLIGDMWTLRIVRSVFNGKRRFQDLRDALAISDPVLSRRLHTLVDDGILEAREYHTNPPRREYVLTEAGLDLWQVLVAMWTWDRTWTGYRTRDAADRAAPPRLRAPHPPGVRLPGLRCDRRGRARRAGSVDDRLLLEASSAARAAPPR